MKRFLAILLMLCLAAGCAAKPAPQAAASLPATPPPASSAESAPPELPPESEPPPEPERAAEPTAVPHDLLRLEIPIDLSIAASAVLQQRVVGERLYLQILTDHNPRASTLFCISTRTGELLAQLPLTTADEFTLSADGIHLLLDDRIADYDFLLKPLRETPYDPAIAKDSHTRPVLSHDGRAVLFCDAAGIPCIYTPKSGAVERLDSLALPDGRRLDDCSYIHSFDAEHLYLIAYVDERFVHLSYNTVTGKIETALEQTAEQNTFSDDRNRLFYEMPNDPEGTRYSMAGYGPYRNGVRDNGDLLLENIATGEQWLTNVPALAGNALLPRAVSERLLLLVIDVPSPTGSLALLNLQLNGDADALLAPQDIPANLKQLAAICKPIFPSSGDTAPSTAQYAAALKQAGAYGFPVYCEGQDMQNAAEVVAFFDQLEAGEDASVTIYHLASWRITADVFTKQGDLLTNTSTEINIAVGSVNPHSPQNLEFLRLGEDGHLIYRGKSDSEDNGNGFRVLPLGARNRALYETYVAPIRYAAGGVLTRNWNAANFSRLYWDFVYEGILKMDEGVELSDKYTEKDTLFTIPAADVEGLLGKYFLVTPQELQKLPAYDAAQKVYAFSGFRGGGYSSELEVVDSVRGADGSLTLTIRFVSLAFNDERTSTGMLTVMPAADGSFRYLSNISDAPNANTPAWGQG